MGGVTTDDRTYGSVAAGGSDTDKGHVGDRRFGQGVRKKAMLGWGLRGQVVRGSAGHGRSMVEHAGKQHADHGHKVEQRAGGRRVGERRAGERHTRGRGDGRGHVVIDCSAPFAVEPASPGTSGAPLRPGSTPPPRRCRALTVTVVRPGAPRRRGRRQRGSAADGGRQQRGGRPGGVAPTNFAKDGVVSGGNGAG